MGTSTSRNGPRPTTPLLPDWPGLPPLPPDPDPDLTPQPPLDPAAPPVTTPPPPSPPHNRYNTPRRAFRDYARSGGGSSGSASGRKAVREYVRTSGGGSKKLARRMFASVQAVQALGTVLGNIVQNGTQSTLTALNLGEYVGAAALDVLAALADAVAPATGQLDEAMARQAYALMVDRIISNTALDMDNLQPADVHEILAVYIEETIVCRVINDIGASLTMEQHDPGVCADLVEDLYQIVHGAVHNDILSGLSGIHPELPPDTSQRMEDIYQLALDILSDV